MQFRFANEIFENFSKNFQTIVFFIKMRELLSEGFEIILTIEQNPELFPIF